VHLCSLAKPYGEALEGGELSIEVIGNEPRVRHYENSWPLAPSSWDPLLLEEAMQGDKESIDRSCAGNTTCCTAGSFLAN